VAGRLMPRRKPTPEPPKRASGPTQPEDERKAKQALLRLLPVSARRLDMLAKRWGCSRSAVVETLLANELHATPDRSVDSK